MRRLLGNRPTVYNLSSSISSAGIALPALLLTQQVTVEFAALSAVKVNAFINRLVANAYLRCDLLWAIFWDRKPSAFCQIFCLIMAPLHEFGALCVAIPSACFGRYPFNPDLQET